MNNIVELNTITVFRTNNNKFLSTFKLDGFRLGNLINRNCRDKIKSTNKIALLQVTN